MNIGDIGLYGRIFHISVCCFLLNIIHLNKQSFFYNDETFSLQGTDGPPGPSGPAGPKGDIVRLIRVPISRLHYLFKLSLDMISERHIYSEFMLLLFILCSIHSKSISSSL